MAQNVPLWKIIARNGFWMSVLYLCAALTLEVARRVYPHPALVETVRRLDDLPGTTLALLGLLPELRRAFAYEQISEVGLRLIFGATTVVVIFALAFATGGLMALVRYWLGRKDGSGRGGNRPI